jgi:catechol 2,3-dioxygenase-like lactoylglutathione lyase family enzyme
VKTVGLEWIGTRTPAFEETSTFFREWLGLPVGMQRPNFVRYDLPDGAAIEVFRPGGEDDHAYFTTGPVVGFQVSDFDASRRELETAGVELLGATGGETGDYRWQHFRGPGGNVFEIVDDPGRKRGGAATGPCRVTGFQWVGIRTSEYDRMRRFAVDILRLPIDEEEPDLVVFCFPIGDTLELFRPGGANDHPHLVTGPMPGLIVEDLARAEAELARHGVEILARKRRGSSGWTHFRAPDGNVYEFKRAAE